VADVFRSYGPAYQERFDADLLPRHRRAMEDLIHCRTEALGGHLLHCAHCGQEHYAYPSCRNRRCPNCHHQDTAVWWAERRQELLPGPYVHVVLPLPQALHERVRRHQQDLYDMLLRAAAQALITLAMAPPAVGGRMGVLCILHTWTRTLTYHPHVHCLVPAGGVSADRTEWRPARTSYLVPVHALAQRFRGLFLALVRQERPDLLIPDVVWTQGRVVYCQPAVHGTENVLHSLGR
jgi:Transposase zinc-binding domain/Putative transposase